MFEFDGRRVLEDNVRRALRALFAAQRALTSVARFEVGTTIAPTVDEIDRTRTASRRDRFEAHHRVSITDAAMVATLIPTTAPSAPKRPWASSCSTLRHRMRPRTTAFAGADGNAYLLRNSINSITVPSGSSQQNSFIQPPPKYIRVGAL